MLNRAPVLLQRMTALRSILDRHDGLGAFRYFNMVVSHTSLHRYGHAQGKTRPWRTNRTKLPTCPPYGSPPKKQHRATTAIGKSRPIVSIPPYLGYLVGRFIGKLKGDVVITIPEIESLMSDLLCVDTPPTTTTGFSDWARSHADTLGLQYTNELARRWTGFRATQATDSCKRSLGYSSRVLQTVSPSRCD
ncbi:hypothetical protein SAMN05660284_00045 [Formivibrio citricus]|uniref:Uncharacterized protein n=1 Tax=Formivibrio citricus TaxID=83765 RepID=A0A1I4UZ79_9NEIS|nr:hypothetical protein SAMN05660284_00045 [Formivibrio citricus]